MPEPGSQHNRMVTSPEIQMESEELVQWNKHLKSNMAGATVCASSREYACFRELAKPGGGSNNECGKRERSFFAWEVREWKVQP